MPAAAQQPRNGGTLRVAWEQNVTDFDPHWTSGLQVAYVVGNLIQRGTNHAWANRSDKPACVAFVLVDAKPLGIGNPVTGAANACSREMLEVRSVSYSFIGRRDSIEVLQDGSFILPRVATSSAVPPTIH